MLQERNQTFETNSSSCHTVVIANGCQWQEFTKSDIKKLTENIDYTELEFGKYYGQGGKPCDTFLSKLAYIITYLTYSEIHFYCGWTISETNVKRVVTKIFSDIKMYFLYDILGMKFVNYIEKDLIPYLIEKLNSSSTNSLNGDLRDNVGYIDHQSTGMIREYYIHIKERYNLDVTFSEYLTQVLFNDNIQIEITSDGGYDQGWEDYFADLTFRSK